MSPMLTCSYLLDRSVDDTHSVIVCANPADARSLLHTSSQPSCKWRLQPFDKVIAAALMTCLQSEYLAEQSLYGSVCISGCAVCI